MSHRLFLFLSIFSFLTLLTVASCGPSSSSQPDDGVPSACAKGDPDADGDGICDDAEGKGKGTDTDGDGTPDYLDDDSDNDGIPDSVEFGNPLSVRLPADSDNDGIPDFRDDDSDENGILDKNESIEDTDEDGAPDFADLDDDEDYLLDVYEITGIPSAPGTVDNPVDSDNDGIPDFKDIDSDNDLILDRDEGKADPDGDSIPSYLDLDSDADCIPDSKEAGDSILGTEPIDTDKDNRPNFHDRDSDADGITDNAEDTNCNGKLDSGETSAVNGDTDNDGASDLVEKVANTDPRNPASNPRANGDFVFEVPFEKDTTPDKDDLDFTTNLKLADIYVLVDRSGSMDVEIGDIVSNIQTVANRITCATNGNSPTCIPDVFWGAGTIGYSGSAAYGHHADMGPSPAPISTIPTTDPGGSNSREATLLSLWMAVTGKSSTDAMCSVSPAISSKTCSNGRFGYPCFRPNALPIILLATDEPPLTGSDTFQCPVASAPNPSEKIVCDAASTVNARIVGIKGLPGTGVGNALQSDLAKLATCTGAVKQDGTAVVENGADANASAAIENAIRTVATGVPLDLAAIAGDVPGDNVDAAAAFISHLETRQLGTPECAAGLMEEDSNDPDTIPDRYRRVLPGTPVCWRLVPKKNTTVPPLDNPQLLKAKIEVYGGGVTLLDTREVFFLVPPKIAEGPIVR